VTAAEMRERARERRARLWSGGVKSSELDVVSPVELRRRIATRRQEVQRAEQQKRLAQAIEAAAECQEAYRLTPFASRGPRQQCADITKACCKHFHLTRMQITSHRRTPAITYPRQIAMYLMRSSHPTRCRKSAGACRGSTTPPSFTLGGASRSALKPRTT
jgi:uncharacterized small protein (DUF1192 family)